MARDRSVRDAEQARSDAIGLQNRADRIRACGTVRAAAARRRESTDPAVFQECSGL
jgi:hypothetical protein